MTIRHTLLLSLALTLGCGASTRPGSPPGQSIPVGNTSAKARVDKTPPRQLPPESGPAKKSAFPAVAWHELPNGLKVAMVESHALPVVQVRVVVHAGSGYTPAMPGVADVTADMLKDGGTTSMTSAKLLERIESLGTSLKVDIDADSSTFSLAVTKDRIVPALALLSELLRAPRFDEGELKKLKTRLTDEAEDAARASGAWAATRIVFHELFPAQSPYAVSNLIPSEIAKINGAAVRDFHRRFYMPENATLILAGDLDAKNPALADAFKTWKGAQKERPKVDFAPPARRSGRKVIVAHRAKSVQSDVFVASMTLDRHSAAFPQLRVANQVLGGGVASRLFADVRERRSLAYSTRSQILELAKDAEPFLAYAGTESAKTAQAIDGLLENMDKLRKSPPTAAELESARRYLSDVFAIRMETIGNIADLVAAQVALDLPDGYWDSYRAAVRATTVAQAAEASAKLVGDGPSLIVVSGDADTIAQDLTRFGEVIVVDPEREFKVMRTLPTQSGGKP
jgi:zinc protease